MMRLIAKDNFHSPGAPRLITAGEVFEATDELAADLILKGLAVPAPAAAPAPGANQAPRETMVKGPKERRGGRPRASE